MVVCAVHVCRPVSSLCINLSVSLRVPVYFYPVPLFIRYLLADWTAACVPSSPFTMPYPLSFPCPLLFFRWHKPVCILRGPGMAYGQQSSCMGHDDFALRKRDFLGLSHDFEAALLTEGAGVFRGEIWDFVYAYGSFEVISLSDHIHWLGVLPPAIWLVCPPHNGLTGELWLLYWDLCVFLSIPGLYNGMLFFVAPSIRRDCWSHSLDVPSCEWTVSWLSSVSSLILYTLSICYGVHLASC